MFSPYDLNPMGVNPLRGLLDEMIDFDKVNAPTCGEVHVTATNVRTGRPRVFGRANCTDPVLASACLPQMFPAVEIDGEAYWDGGFSGNPALYPLLTSATRPTSWWCRSTRLSATNCPARARNHEPRQRDQLQLQPGERASGDRPDAARGRGEGHRSWRLYPYLSASDPHRLGSAGSGRLQQAECRMELS